MRAPCVCLIILLSFTPQLHAWSWHDLWATKDQQAQILMNKSQFPQAKDTFTRDDWRAAATYRAGEYEQAATSFGALNNEPGYYNQGNALAHLGNYEDAVKAYDRALAINPANQDAVYNRDLVKKLLEKDKKQQQQDKHNQDKQNQDKQNQDKQNQDKQNQDKQNQDKQNQDKQNQDKQNQDKQNQDKQNQDKQNQDKQNQDKQNQDKQNQDKQNQDKQNQDKQNQDKQNQDKQNQDKQNQDKQNQDKQNQNKQNKDQKKKDKPSTDTAQSPADHEKQQAKEQWLRLVPDDPGGLMREKFLRDHLRRQQGLGQ